MAYIHWYTHGETLNNALTNHSTRQLEAKISILQHELDELRDEIRTEWFYSFCYNHVVEAYPEDGKVQSWFGESITIEAGQMEDYTPCFIITSESGREWYAPVEKCNLMDNGCMRFDAGSFRMGGKCKGYLCISNWKEILGTPATC